MGRVVHVRASDLAKVLRADLRDLDRRIRSASAKAARRGTKIVRKNVPIAFSELKDSVDSRKTKDGASITATAPHAAPVETGSRPHMPPLAPLVRWVKLRGMQGLTRSGKVIRNLRKDGLTIHRQNREVSRVIAMRLRLKGNGSMTPVDAAEQVAREIQFAIAKRGTPPTWYARRSLPELRELLHEEITTAVKSDHGSPE